MRKSVTASKRRPEQASASPGMFRTHPSRSESYAMDKSLRVKSPRASHADWNLQDRVKAILGFANQNAVEPRKTGPNGGKTSH